MVKEVTMPIDFAVAENSSFKLVIPIEILESAIISDKVHVATFNFVGRKGRPFGENIKIKFKVQKAIDEVQFYQTAMELFDYQGGDGPELQFDDIVKILKQVQGDRNAAKELMAVKRNNLTMEKSDLDSCITENNMEI